MKKVLLLFLVYLNISFVFSQNTVRFNKSYIINGCNSHAGSLIKHNAKYYALGFCTNTIQTNGISVLVCDTLGNEISQKQIYNPSNYLNFSNSIRPFVQVNTDYAIFSGEVSPNFNHFKGVLYKISLSKIDTVWYKAYNQPGDSSYFDSCTSLPDSSLIVFGNRYFISNNITLYKPFMMKVDKNGNYKWHKYLTVNWVSYKNIIHKVINVDNNQLIIIGARQIVSWSGFIMKIDTNANIYYNVGIVGSPNCVVQDAIILNDGTGLAVGASYTNLSLTRKLVYQFDVFTGAKIKSHLFNFEANSNGAGCVVQKSNGTILIGGGTGEVLPSNSTNFIPDVLKLNSNLDSLATIFFPIPINSQLAPYSILSSTDGGFITALFHMPISGQQKNWLIKADSADCFEVNCPVNNGLEEIEKEIGELKVWPNPAQSFIEVHYPNVIKSEYLNISIYNSLGQLVYKEEQTNLSETVKINIDKFASGLYHMQVKTKSASYDSKFIIQR